MECNFRIVSSSIAEVSWLEGVGADIFYYTPPLSKGNCLFFVTGQSVFATNQFISAVAVDKYCFFVITFGRCAQRDLHRKLFDHPGFIHLGLVRHVRRRPAFYCVVAITKKKKKEKIKLIYSRSAIGQIFWTTSLGDFIVLVSHILSILYYR